jgi:hypothetical protein
MEPKCQFFIWLALLTTENLTIHGWPHDSMYKLCRIHPEMVRHLLVSEKTLAWNDSLGMAPPPMNKTIQH